MSPRGLTGPGGHSLAPYLRSPHGSGDRESTLINASRFLSGHGSARRLLEPERGAEADEREHREDDHRDHVRGVARGEVRDEDRAGDGRAEGRAEVGDAARETGDLTLLLLGEAGLHEV